MGNVTDPSKLNTSRLNISFDIARYQLLQLGWQGMLGLLLILGSLAYLFLQVVPKANQVQQLQLDARNFKRNSKLYAQDHKAGKFDVVKDFYRLLPAQNEANSSISMILNAATNAGLSLEKVEYDQPLSQHPITQYQINLPIKGSYVQIRQFINEVLNKIPTIALNDISMRRDDVSTDILETRIQFILYLKNTSE
ncbi:MAG: type 4a pilus biogenesis protein PilO [Methylophilus sp.]